MVCPARARRDSSNLARQFTDLTNLRRCGRSQQFLRLSQPHTEVGRGSSGNANSPAGRNVIRALKGLWFLAGAALLLGSEVWPPTTPPAPLIGFSYSPLMLYGAQRDPAQDLQSLLDATNPDLIRLPVYWEAIQPTPDTLDFSSVDELLTVVEDHNQFAARPTRVVLTVGARNFLYPELHAPQWAGPRQQPYLNDVQSGSSQQVT